MYKKLTFLIIAGFAWYMNYAPEMSAHEGAQTLSIQSGGAIYHFDIELAETFQQKQKGLMHRTHLNDMSAMLFLHESPRIISMWMKNTLIPLDMLFINEEGTVLKIHHNAEPHSETPISSEFEAVAVLEVNGGLTRKLNITIGDKVSYADTFTP